MARILVSALIATILVAVLLWVMTSATTPVAPSGPRVRIIPLPPLTPDPEPGRSP